MAQPMYFSKLIEITSKCESLDNGYSFDQIMSMRKDFHTIFSQQMPSATESILSYESEMAVCIKVIPLHIAEIFQDTINPWSEAHQAQASRIGQLEQIKLVSNLQTPFMCRYDSLPFGSSLYNPLSPEYGMFFFVRC